MTDKYYTKNVDDEVVKTAKFFVPDFHGIFKQVVKIFTNQMQRSLNTKITLYKPRSEYDVI